MMATCGVRRESWTAASERGARPSRAKANSDRGPVSTVPQRNPNIETVAPTSMNERPAGPTTTAAASASGATRSTGKCVTQQPLRNDLNRDVEDHDARDGNEHRPGDRPRRIAHLAARLQRALNAEEREDQDTRGAHDRDRRRARRPRQVVGPHEGCTDHDKQQRAARAWRSTAISTRRAPPPTLRMLIAAAAASTAAISTLWTTDDEVPISAAADAANAEATAPAAASALRTLRTPVTEARKRSERSLDVRVGSSARRYATSRLGEAHHAERHDERAHQIRKDRGRTQLRGNDSRQHEDAAADGVVEYHRGELPNP